MLSKRILLSLPLFFMVISSSLAAGITDFSGKPKSIEDYKEKGKWQVVMIWASDCHICNREAHQYVDFHFAHSDKDATVLGISVDGLANKKAAQKYIDKHSVNFPNLIGEPETVGNLFTELTGSYRVGTPTFLIYGPDGKLMAQQVGAVPTNIIEDFMANASLADKK